MNSHAFEYCRALGLLLLVPEDFLIALWGCMQYSTAFWGCILYTSLPNMCIVPVLWDYLFLFILLCYANAITHLLLFI
jgi:hypothetical protein